MLTTEALLKTRDGNSLFFRSWQPDTDPIAVICLIHGLGEHTGRYEHVAHFFANKGIAMVGFDLHGHGRSDGVRGYTKTLELVMDDIDTLINKASELSPGVPQFLYGHSLGGNLVLYHAITHPSHIKGAVVTAPALGIASPAPAWKVSLAKILSSLWPTFSMANGLDRSGLSRDPEIEKAYNSDPLVHGKITAQLGWDLLTSGKWLLDHVDDFPLPLLLMQGSADRLVSPKATAQFAQKMDGKVTFKIWNGLYHELHNEPEKDEVLQFMLTWIIDIINKTT